MCLCRLSPICLDVAALHAGISAGESAVLQTLEPLLLGLQPADCLPAKAYVEANGMEGMALYGR